MNNSNNFITFPITLPEHLLPVSPENICICFDDDGVLHEWRNLKIDVPESYTDMTKEEQDIYMHDEVYKQLLSPGYYRNLKPVSGMTSLTKELVRLGFDVRVLSCSINDNTDGQKHESLGECVPWIPKENIILIPDGEGRKKYDYLPDDVKEGKLVILVDDHTPNCVAFETAGGTAVKCMNDVNGKGGTWQGTKVYADDPEKSLSVLLTTAAQCWEAREELYAPPEAGERE